MPRLLFLNRYYWPDESATAQILTDLATEFTRRGHTVEVITGHQLYTAPSASLRANETVNGVRVRRIWSTRFGRSSLFGRAVDYVSFLLSVTWAVAVRARRFDVVVAKSDPPKLGVVCTAIARLTRTPVIQWRQDLFPEIAAAYSSSLEGSLLIKLLTTVRNASISRSAAVVVPGFDMKNLLEEISHDRTPIEVIPNWPVSIDPPAENSDANPLAAEWGLDGKFVIGYSGNLGRVHDYQTIVDAAELLADLESVRFLIIGAGASNEQLRANLPASVSGRFVFKPYQPRDRLRESLTLPDAHWLSLDSRFANLVFPSKFYGIIAAGRPVIFIGPSNCELARLINENRVGFAVPPGDATTFATHARRLIEDPR